MLNLERESEVDPGCLYRLGYPGEMVPGEGFEPPLVTELFRLTFQFQLSRSLWERTPALQRGSLWTYRNR